MLPKQQIVLKTFILENQSTQHSQVIISPVQLFEQYVDLSKLISQNVNNYQTSLFRVYNFNINQYQYFTDISNKCYCLPKNMIINAQPVVLIKYKYANHQQSNSSFKQTFSESDDLKDIISDSSSLKKQRAKQRAIAQVIQIVKRWRQLHLQKRGQKKISLLQAAKLVGLPKKSLDDYYYQLRLGEKYDFDFKKNLFEGIGCLRNFLKDKNPKLKSQNSEKRPKNLKIIQQFDQMRMKSYNMDQQHHYKSQQQNQLLLQHQQKLIKQQEKLNNNNNNNNQHQKQQQINHSNNYNNSNNKTTKTINPPPKKQNKYQSQPQKQQIFQQQQQQQQQQMRQINQQEYKYNHMLQQERDSMQMKLQNQFYQDFGYMDSFQLQDPFVNLGANFKKKKFQNIFDQQLFF